MTELPRGTGPFTDLVIVIVGSVIISWSLMAEAVTDWRRRMRRIYPGEVWL